MTTSTKRIENIPDDPTPGDWEFRHHENGAEILAHVDGIGKIRIALLEFKHVVNAYGHLDNNPMPDAQVMTASKFMLYALEDLVHYFENGGSPEDEQHVWWQARDAIRVAKGIPEEDDGGDLRGAVTQW